MMNERNEQFEEIKLRLNSMARAENKSPDRFSEKEIQALKDDFADRFNSVFPNSTHSEIARTLDSHPSTIKLYAEAKRFPVPEMLIFIHRKTGINIHWLLTGEGSPSSERTSLFNAEEVKRINKFSDGADLNETIRKLTLTMVETLEKF